MTSTILTLVIGLIGLFCLVARFAWLNSELRDRADWLVHLATGGRVKHALGGHDEIVAGFQGLITQQRAFGGDAERIKRARCPSASLSMRERWVLCAMGQMNGEIVPSLNAIALKLGLKPELVSLIARTLAATGFAKLVFLASDQGEAAGKGYVLTDDGIAAKAAILERHENRSTSPRGAVQRLSEGVAVPA